MLSLGRPNLSQLSQSTPCPTPSTGYLNPSTLRRRPRTKPFTRHSLTLNYPIPILNPNVYCSTLRPLRLLLLVHLHLSRSPTPYLSDLPHNLYVVVQPYLHVKLVNPFPTVLQSLWPPVASSSAAPRPTLSRSRANVPTFPLCPDYVVPPPMASSPPGTHDRSMSRCIALCRLARCRHGLAISPCTPSVELPSLLTRSSSAMLARC
jgi:hypothetical protein